MATALKYQQDLDRSKPISERFGGRFLTEDEVDALFELAMIGGYEQVAMNLEHMYAKVAGMGEVRRESGPRCATQQGPRLEMSDVDLVVLLSLVRDMRALAELFGDLGQRVESHAWDLWSEARDSEHA